MKTKIIEIVELGEQKSLIHRENEPITELIQTTDLVDELNQQLRVGSVSQQRELLINYNNYLYVEYFGSDFDDSDVDVFLEQMGN